MLTAEDYRQSIRDGRASYLEGRRIEDPVTHPLLRVSVDWVASTYEQTRSSDPRARKLCVVPSGEVPEEDADRAIACAVPVDTPGLKIISITTAPRAEDPRHFPISRERSIPDCTVLFDEVFVPWDRVFLDSEVAYSAALADALGTWERARAVATLADEAELIYGLAQTIVEMNGVPDATHIRDKLSKMAVWASMCRAGWTAALVHAATTETGMVVPADAHVYATMAYGLSLFNEMVAYLHDVSGGLLLTCPTVADYENPETHAYMEKYLRTM